MGVRISREADGRVSIQVNSSGTGAAVITPVEARLLAIKLLLAAEQLEQLEPR
jgi:hypothetical protein